MKRLLVVLTFVMVIAAFASGWWWTRGSLPVLDGEVAVPGLSTPVEVLFDGHGVPHVYATNEEMAWFAAGVMHARDRRWQMELYRRVTIGRLSEVLGDTTIPFDQRFLTLGMRDAAEAEWKRAAPQVRVALEAYAAGVNAATAQMSGRLRPIEFQILGITPPAWTPVDSLAIGRLLAWRLAENHRAELVDRRSPRNSAKPSRATYRVYTPLPPPPSSTVPPGRRRPPARPWLRGRFPPAWNGWRQACDAATATTGYWRQVGPRRAGRSLPTTPTCRSSCHRCGTRCTSSRLASM